MCLVFVVQIKKENLQKEKQRSQHKNYKVVD